MCMRVCVRVLLLVFFVLLAFICFDIFGFGVILGREKEHEVGWIGMCRESGRSLVRGENIIKLCSM